MQILMGIGKYIHPHNNHFSPELEPVTPESYPCAFAVITAPLSLTKVLVTQLCLILHNRMDRSLPGSSVHGIL